MWFVISLCDRLAVIGVFALVVACGADHEWPRFLKIMDDDDRVQRCVLRGCLYL